MATRTLGGDMETIGPTDNPVISPLNVSVSVILPVIVDTLSHGYKKSAANKHGVLDGHSLTIQATGAGNINVLDSHQIWRTIVYSGASKTFTAEGNEVGNHWNVA